MSLSIRLIIFITSLGCLSGCASTVESGLYPPPQVGGDNRIIYLTSYKNHTGLVLPRKASAPWIPALSGQFPEAQYLEYGWGDLKWYQADKKERTSGLALRAFVSPSDSGLFVWALPKHPDLLFSEEGILTVEISNPGFKQLAKFINDSFALDANHRSQSVKEGYYRKGEYRIYRAQGRYHAFGTCNNWTVKALESAGLPVGGIWGFRGKGIFDRMKRIVGGEGLRADSK